MVCNSRLVKVCVQEYFVLFINVSLKLETINYIIWQYY